VSERKRSLLAVGVTLAFVVLLLVLRAASTAAPEEVLRSESTAEGTSYSGSWHFPRGGPYVLGFEAEGPARLFIDGKLAVQGQGQQAKRLVYQAGNYALRVETEGDFRLLWHPPGRRGPLEYVPASSLSPESEAAHFERPGTSIGDGLYAAAIVFALLLCIAYLNRKALAECDRVLLLCTLATLLGALALRCIGLDAQGQTWDEDVNWSAGRNYITNLLSLDFSESSWRWNYEHPPVMKYIAGIGAQFSDGYSVSRGLSALLGAAACALMLPIGARLYNLRVGVLAGGIAALSPHLLAHSKVVGHEAPTLFFWALAIWLSLRAHDESDDPYRLHKRFAVLGVVLGLAVFSRYINGLMAPLIGAILLVQASPEERKRTFALGLSIIPIAAVLTCILVWPRMWSEPILHLQESWAKLKRPHGLEPYLGQMTEKPGPSYFFVYLWATAPLGVVLLAKAWLLRLAILRERSSLVLLLWLAIPFVVTFSPVRQDGVRYIMPALLALTMAAAVGVDALARWIPRLNFSWIGGALCLYLAVVLIRIHPFYLDYYGEQVGGPESVAAAKRFEIAWWGEGMNEALDYLNANAEPGARVYKRCFEPGHLAWMRGDLWNSEARRPEQAQWFLVYQPSVRPCPVPPDAKLVFESTAQGAPLARVYRR
jgi:4-amino-4-deoxy-L-arabinose transferase-like glycosyltransferase